MDVNLLLKTVNPQVYDLEEAIDCHRETHHPTQYNAPDAPVDLNIELSLATNKKVMYFFIFNEVQTSATLSSKLLGQSI